MVTYLEFKIDELETEIKVRSSDLENMKQLVVKDDEKQFTYERGVLIYSKSSKYVVVNCLKTNFTYTEGKFNEYT